jgi:hypothetical protein
MKTAIRAVVLASLLATVSVPGLNPMAVHAQDSGCNGQNVAVGVDYMKARRTTDGVKTPFGKINPTDEVYFLATGAKVEANGNSIPVSLPKSSQVNFKDGKAYDPLYKAATPYVCLGDGDAVNFTVMVREDDDFDVQDLRHAVTAGAAATAGILTGIEPLGALAIDEARKGYQDLKRQLDKGPDDTSGSYLLSIKNEGGQMRYYWQPLDGTTMMMSGDWEGPIYAETWDTPAVSFKMNADSIGRYLLAVSIWAPPN